MANSAGYEDAILLEPFFVMKPQRHGQLRYALLAVIPAAVSAFLIGPFGAAWIFVFLAGLLIFPSNHRIVVFENSITEKDFRGRFIRKIDKSQVAFFRKNVLGEIVLVDNNNQLLLRAESYLSNRDRFDQWIESHHIEFK